MTDPTTPDREEIRRKARERAVRMGHAVQPEPEAPPAAPLPTKNPRVLRHLLDTGRLTPAQAATARRLFAEARQHIIDYPED